MAEAAAVAAWVELTVSKMSRVGWGGMVARPCQCGLVNVCSWGAAPRALTFEWRRGGQKPPSNIVAVEKKSGRFVGAKPPQRNPVLGPLGRGLDYSSFFQHHEGPITGFGYYLGGWVSTGHSTGGIYVSIWPLFRVSVGGMYVFELLKIS